MSLATQTLTSPPAGFAVLRGATPALSAATHADAVRGELVFDFDLTHSGRQRVSLRYELVGDAELPVVFVAGGISAHRHLAANATFGEPGWWNAQVGVGRALDPTRHRLLAIDWLGSDGDLDVVIDPADQADVIAALLHALRIDKLASFVGSSYGAMVGLQFAARHGDLLGQLIAISGVHRAHPYSSACRALQRRAVALGALQCDESHGLALARQLAMLSYRTPEEFEQRFGPARVVNGQVCAAAEEYLDHCGAVYVERTNPRAFARLSESIDLQDVAPERIALPVTVVAVAQDRLVPLADAHALVDRLRGDTRLCVLQSAYGHDAFLKEEAAIAKILRESLDNHLEVVA